MSIGAYILKNKLRGWKQYPLIIELEPLFACNLACLGCGKIQYPADILKKRLSVEDAVTAIEESGAPMVSLAGGEPLMHSEIVEMTEALIAKKRYIFLCTNGVIMERKLEEFKPHRNFTWVVHLDGSDLAI